MRLLGTTNSALSTSHMQSELFYHWLHTPCCMVFSWWLKNLSRTISILMVSLVTNNSHSQYFAHAASSSPFYEASTVSRKHAMLLVPSTYFSLSHKQAYKILWESTGYESRDLMCVHRSTSWPSMTCHMGPQGEGRGATRCDGDTCHNIMYTIATVLVLCVVHMYHAHNKIKNKEQEAIIAWHQVLT
jgi:hypothetical protein